MSIAAGAFLDAARARGLRFFCGVPCSFLTPLINQVIADPASRYVGAASEGEAVAIAAGAWLAGHGSVVMFQNSGLGNAVNPLTSLSHPFRIPALLVVTWRGGPGVADEPQHEVMGAITPSLLDTIGIPAQMFPAHESAIEAALDAACAGMQATGIPHAFIMEKGAVTEEPADLPTQIARPLGALTRLTTGGAAPARYQLLERTVDALPADAAVIATTGKCGRELFTVADRAAHLYQVGSMGCAAGMGLGVALTSDRPVVVLDGDGAALMKLGTLATIGGYAAENLVHLLFDNGVHDSTGGQPTVSPAVDFAAVAIACGYRAAWTVDDPAGFQESLAAALAGAGPAMIHAKVAPGSIEGLGRPTITPPEVASRFRSFLAGSS